MTLAEPGGGGPPLEVISACVDAELAQRLAAQAGDSKIWRQQIADCLAQWPGVRAAGVYTSAVGYPFAHQGAIAPAHHRPLVDGFFRNKLQEIHRRDPSGVAKSLGLGSRAHAPLALAEDRALVRHIESRFLAPLHARGMLTAFLTDCSEQPLGWLALASEASHAEALRRLGPPLTRVAEQASRTLRAAIELAKGCGLLLPTLKTPPGIGLSKRELEVARLVGAGYSDLNVARQLGICENTVGVHLQRIYRKLGVHSRVDLVGLAGLIAE